MLVGGKIPTVYHGQFVGRSNEVTYVKYIACRQSVNDHKWMIR